MVCKVADFVVELKNLSPQIEKFFSYYLSHQKPEMFFEISEQDIKFECKLTDLKYSSVNSEMGAYLRKFSQWILNKNSFLLHSALIDIDGTGVAFAAPSGTGKTTHMLLWQRLLGDKMTIVNGDKPIVRFFENEQFPIGYGTPWNGKERLGNNSKTPIKHLCFIERADTNSCEKTNPTDVLDLFFKQIYIPKNNTSAVFKTLNLADQFLNKVNIWKIKCNMDISAAEVAYNTIFKEN